MDFSILLNLIICKKFQKRNRKLKNYYLIATIDRRMSISTEQPDFAELEITKATAGSHVLIIDYDEKAVKYLPKIIPWKPTPDISALDSDDEAPSRVHFNSVGMPFPEPIRGFKGNDGVIRLFRPKDVFAAMEGDLMEDGLPPMNFDKLLKCIEKWLDFDSENLTADQAFYIRFLSYSDYYLIPEGLRLRCDVVPSKQALDYGGDFKPLKLYALIDSRDYDEPEGENVESEGEDDESEGEDYESVREDDESVREDYESVREDDESVREDYESVGEDDDEVLKDKVAYENGCDQVLFIYKNEVLGTCTSDGDSNFFVVWINDDNKKQLVTYTLESDDYVIPGITRDSVLHLLAEYSDLVVTEKRFSLDDLTKKAHEGRLVEAFSCGIYDSIAPVGMIKLQSGEELIIPTTVENKWGEVSKRLYDTLIAIMTGEIEHDWCHICHSTDPDLQLSTLSI